MYLGIEIGGTKLQFGVGTGDGTELAAFERREVDPHGGAAGILEQIEHTAKPLIARNGISTMGIGFGGPVDAARGRVIKSHQVAGWDEFPLVDWCRETLGVFAVLGNDCDSAALAEARFGAGRGKRTVFYVTVGTGVGGGLVIDGELHGKGRPAVAEIGHLRPGLEAVSSGATVEAAASGRGIETAMRQRLQPRSGPPIEAGSSDVADLMGRCTGDVDRLTAKHIAEAAADGNELALDALRHALRTLGWAVAQVVTLLAPEVVVVGGGVSLIGEALFFEPLRREVGRYVFPPLADSYQIVPAQGGERVVVQGALALAAGTPRGHSS